ncbi:hypothetical protein MCAMS1_00089 [biofilm metagenome]
MNDPKPNQENMPITGINHINIEVSTEQLPKVRTFYEDVLGLKIGFRAKSKRDGAWLYAGNQPVIHLSVNDEPLTADKTCFNHVAFACSGVAQCKRDLDIQGVEYMLEQRSLADKEMTQIFLYDPVGIKIELNFAGETL